MKHSVATMVLSTTCALTFALAFASPARAEPGTKAKEHFARAVELVEKEDYEGAAAEFQRAYEISPSPVVLYNLGQAYIALARPVQAVDALTRYLETGGESVSPQRRQQVQAALAAQEALIGTIRLEVEPHGAAVSIDGAEIDAGEMQQGLRFGVGEHLVRGTLEGYIPVERAVSVSGGETVDVDLKLVPVSPREPSTAALWVRCSVKGVKMSVDGKSHDLTNGSARLRLPPGSHEVAFLGAGVREEPRQVVLVGDGGAIVRCKPSAAGSPAREPSTEELRKSSSGDLQRAAGYVAVGAGVIGLGTGLAFGLKTTSTIEERDAKPCIATPPCTDSEISDIQSLTSSAQKSATISTVGFVAGGVLAAGGVVLLVTAPSSEGTQAVLAPWVAPDSGGLQLRLKL